MRLHSPLFPRDRSHLADPVRPAPRDRAADIAVIWSLVYGLLAIWWTVDGTGFPFGRGHDPDPDYSNLARLEPGTAAPVIAVWALVAGGAALILSSPRSPRRLSLAAVAMAWITAAALLLVVPDFRVLIRVAYAPVVIAGAPFGWPPDLDYAEFFQWAVLNQYLCIVGGVALAFAALRGQRRLVGACEACGRHAGANRWTSAEGAARWGTWATWIAVLLPLFYSVTRWAWALGIPVGVTDEFLHREAEDTPMIWYAGAFLATIGAAGGLLTLGLIRPWGERFPRWMGRLAGKPVPPHLAIVPASLIAILIVETGIMYNRMALTGTWDEEFRTGNWATVVPEMTWPLWGLALGAATLAYHYRRRGRCGACGFI